MNRIRATAMIEETVKSEAVLRLKRIEGQIRGIQKMIEHDRSHNDIVIQLSAAEKAINSVSLILLKGYVEMRVQSAGLLAVADTLKDNSVAAVKKTLEFGFKRDHADWRQYKDRSGNRPYCWNKECHPRGSS